MADHAVWLTKTFLFGVAGDTQKNVVAIGEMTLEVRLADNNFILIKKLLNTSERRHPRHFQGFLASPLPSPLRRLRHPLRHPGFRRFLGFRRKW